ncbi:MAG: ribosome-associated translation inhibitor RaiA [Dehalococcoidia bacterium]|nr:ribosome-associated translation inhibitor RaiA [Dehalococcoidia bacterium]
MDLLIKGKNLEVGDEVRRYVERKIGRLDRYLPLMSEGTIELVHEPTRAASDQFVAQATLNSHGVLIRSEERAATLYAAIDAVVDTLHRQLTHFKGKIYQRARAHGGRPPKEISADMLAAAIPESPPQGALVRNKRFDIKPMSPEEACQQIELLGHTFFFLNADTQQYNVVYRRRDGNYGLIEPGLALR